MNIAAIQKIKAACATMAIAASLVGAASAQAQLTIPLLDQIGPSSATVSYPVYDSQIFESAYTNFNTGAVDDFSAPATFLRLTQVQAVIGGYNTYTGTAGVTGWNVEIWSSAAAAAASLTGNIANITLTPAQVMVDTGFSSATEALVTLPIAVNLPAAGTYYVSVIANNSFTTNGNVGPFTYTPGTGGKNGFQTNPGGGYSATPIQDSADFAYRVYATTTVPEPSAYAMMGIGAIAMVATIRLRRRAG